MKNSEYTNRVSEIRVLMNRLVDDMGSTYDNAMDYLDKVINDAVDGDLVNVDEEAEVELPHGLNVPLLGGRYFERLLPFGPKRRAAA